jgi:quercetin dioxygenase-like cupin family protein
MVITDLVKTAPVDLTPEELKGKASATVYWLIGEPEGAPNFEMRYFSLEGEITTDWHSHSWEHEVFVLGGKGKVRTEDGEFELTANNAVFIEPDRRHQFINTSKDEAFRFICVVPKGTRACTIAGK